MQFIVLSNAVMSGGREYIPGEWPAPISPKLPLPSKWQV